MLRGLWWRSCSQICFQIRIAPRRNSILPEAVLEPRRFYLSREPRKAHANIYWQEVACGNVTAATIFKFLREPQKRALARIFKMFFFPLFGRCDIVSATDLRCVRRINLICDGHISSHTKGFVNAAQYSNYMGTGVSRIMKIWYDLIPAGVIVNIFN